MSGARPGRVVLLGLDGFDPGLVEGFWREGRLPQLARLRDRGGWARIRTTTPAQTPVAWSTVATGTNPGRHGIFDFLRRDPATYLPDISLHAFERRGAFLPPKLVNRRAGTTLWERTAAAGIATTILRFPGSWPPDSIRGGRMLSGVGVPDLRGGFGTSFFLTARDEAGAGVHDETGAGVHDEAGAGKLDEVPRGENEEVVRLRPVGDGRWSADLPGPRGSGGARVTVPVLVEVDGNALRVAVDGGEARRIGVRSWSDWFRVRFRMGALQSRKGQLRVHPTRAGSEPALYISPVQPIPEEPVHPISHPWEWADDLRRELGDFHTLGMAEEHQGLSNGRLDEEGYLAQCRTVMGERRAMLHHALDRQSDGLVACVFDTPDRLQHMFWRFLEADHPSHAAHGGRREGFEETIAAHYAECDALVGEVADRLAPDDLLIVLSDHGFGSFRTELHLNTVLHEAGLLALKGAATPASVEGDLFAEVDWDRTSAYAAGLAGIWLNQRGREANGIVDPAHREAVRSRVREAVSAVLDEGRPAVHAVLDREAVYQGPRLDDAPDLIVNTRPGIRVSSRTAMGGFGPSALTPNTGRWSGDHVVDPAAVPGICLTSRPFRTEGADLLDIAPTLNHAFGLPDDPGFEGRKLF